MPADSSGPFRLGRGVLVAMALVYVLGAWFYIAQNRPGQLGGPITLENALWLSYTLAAWFVLPFVLMRDRRLPAVLRDIFGLFFISFALRGVVEIYMLFGPKNWVSPYGMGHDFGVLAMLVGYIGLHWRRLVELKGVERWLAAFLGVLCLSLAAEMGFAYVFFDLVRGQTDRLWFATYETPFASLNLWMGVTVLAAHLHLGLFLARLSRP